MKENIKIHIGQYHASKEPAVIFTVLGSCVSVCLFDPVTKVGGMNHILRVGDGESATDESARYGINAMELLINDMVSLGAIRTRLMAKLFGGGNILGLPGQYQQGPKNVDFIIEFLKTENMKLAGQNTGGRFSRKLYYHTDTFEALLKKSSISMQEEPAKAEQNYTRVKTVSDKAGEITLF